VIGIENYMNIYFNYHNQGVEQILYVPESRQWYIFSSVNYFIAYISRLLRVDLNLQVVFKN